MRPIKYRAFVKPIKEMAQVLRIDIDKEEAFIKCFNRNCDGNLKWYHFDDLEIIQFTGFKDKLGIEIHEGDIYRQEKEHDEGDYITYFVCTWMEELGQFAWLSTGEYLSYVAGDPSFFDQEQPYPMGTDGDNDKRQIIGNIYQNPELLIA